MQEIKLNIEEKNVEVVLNILENLKAGLITSIETQGKTTKSIKQTQYQPKQNTIIREEESGTSDKSGKYASPQHIDIN